MNAEQIQEGAGVTFVWRADMVDGQGESSLSEEEVIRVAEWARTNARPDHGPGGSGAPVLAALLGVVGLLGILAGIAAGILAVAS